jgi:hypothetical protein
MVIPGMDKFNFYQPPHVGVRELNLSDAWRARWFDGDGLPGGAQVAYGYAAVFCDEKGYVTRPAGTEPWGIAEGPLEPGEKPLAWVKRAALQQVGASGGQVELLGYLECRATTHNPDFAPGTVTIRPLYMVVAKTVKDIGKSSGYERRRLPLNEFGAAIRNRYPEIVECVVKTLDRYVILARTGQLKL